jgi:hypothetical protein
MEIQLSVQQSHEGDWLCYAKSSESIRTICEVSGKTAANALKLMSQIIARYSVDFWDAAEKGNKFNIPQDWRFK